MSKIQQLSPLISEIEIGQPNPRAQNNSTEHEEGPTNTSVTSQSRFGLNRFLLSFTVVANMVRFKWSICPSNSHLLGASNGGPTSPTALVTHCRTTLHSIDVRGCVGIPRRDPAQLLADLPRLSTFALHS